MTGKTLADLSSCTTERPENGARPCLESHPYQTIVFARLNGTTPLYWVGGVAGGPWGAEKALREAGRKHGGRCFYCQKALTKETVTIDHIEGRAGPGAKAIQNLALACKPCNAKKGHIPIEAFKPKAGREWLKALLVQVEDRLQKLG
ncbi:HNH endonuclease [Sphingopyxis sp. XHP0097]|uniref:HNH endonuclease n=1 Tax=Sphingopyxis jiangsuensis TaxID=2871171 RepID=A0ABS7M9T0_9SPHN|nr:MULTISPECIES: HNH endonuclease signature motif containing protein [Sphingopyxis]MBL0769984.1 HNH endonuclease [Sphingopyxis lutea]MBY4635785.1 HNH endonuclease [Sphingopyxis jiangsuensis]